MLTRLVQRKQQGRETKRAMIKAADSRVLARGERDRSGAITVSIPANVRAEHAQVLDAVGQILRQFA